MHRHAILAAGLGLYALSAAFAAAQESSPGTEDAGASAETSTEARASFAGAAGAASGSAQLTQTRSGVLIEIEVSGLPPGQWLGFHIHENGECNHEGGHEAAGAHFNPTGAEHGYLSDTGPHAGDMPNIRTDADGMARAQVLNAQVTLDEGEAAIRGRTLMIHAQPDDYRSQPSGEAGDRLACAVIE